MQTGALLPQQPALLIIDADEARAQRLARLVTCAHLRAVVALTPFLAVQRLTQAPLAVRAIILGTVEAQQNFFLGQLQRRLAEALPWQIPLLNMPLFIPDAAPLVADAAQSSRQHSSASAALAVLQPLWPFFPEEQRSLAPTEHAQVFALPLAEPPEPRIARQLRSQNKHLRQILRAARAIIPGDAWERTLTDVGLAQFIAPGNWPPEDDAYAVPPEYITCLQQAVALAHPDDAVACLRQWSDAGTQPSLQARAVSLVTQQAFRLLTREQAVTTVLKAFAREMNTIRGEDLHVWAHGRDGTHYLIHYSNLYAYGRLRRSTPQCHVWSASIAATLRLVGIEQYWDVTEIECSCQTLTGHCVFAVTPRG